jgi:hypothetical protein
MRAGEQEFVEALKRMKKSTQGGVARLTDLALKGDPRQDYKHVVGALCHQLRKTRPQHRWVGPGGARESTRTVPMILLQTQRQPRVPLASSPRQPSRDPKHPVACTQTRAVDWGVRGGEGCVAVFAVNLATSRSPCPSRLLATFQMPTTTGVHHPGGQLSTGMLMGCASVAIVHVLDAILRKSKRTHGAKDVYGAWRCTLVRTL